MAEAAPSEEPHENTEGNGQENLQPAMTFEVMQRLSISASEVWLYYLGMGGSLDEWEVTSYLHGVSELETLDRDMISQAVNELYDDLRRSPRAPYSWQCAEQEPTVGSGMTAADVDVDYPDDYQGDEVGTNR